MGQLVEARRGFPDKPDLLRLNFGILSDRFPGNVFVNKIKGTLHRSTPFTCSVSQNRPNARFLSTPLMRE